MATINHKTYNEGTETFKDFSVYDGKDTLIFNVDGANQTVFATNIIGGGSIKTSDNSALSGTLKALSDGLGNDSTLSLSTSEGKFNGLLSVAAFSISDLSTSPQLSLTRTATQFTGIAIRGSVAADRALFSVASDDALHIGRHAGGGGAWEKQVSFLDNGLVGIGTSTASRLLTLKNNAGATNGISFQSLATTGEIAAIECNQTLDTIDFEMYSAFAGNGFRFLTGTPTLVERARFTANGLTFNGDTLAANALDDYEEGTFTPTIIGSITAGTATYGGGQAGSYTKIGRMVYFNIYLGYSGGTGTGDLRIAGLPFTIASADIPSFSIGTFLNVTVTASNVPITSGVGNSNQVRFDQIPTGGGTQTAVPYDDAAVIAVSGCYQV